MALSPGIPTSFVPKQPVQPGTLRPMNSGTNIFLIASLILAGIIALLTAGVFAYDRYLIHQLASKKEDLAAAQANVNENTIEEFLRLRDRLTNGQQLLDNHVMLSQFLDVLEINTLQNVRFSDMKINIAGDNTAKLEMTGSARSFNALAAQSNTFASEKRIKRAIFSGITVTEANVVTFKLTADIDPKLIVEDPSQPASAAGAQTFGTASTTGTTTTTQ